ncbi:MAG: MFS transporter [Pseudomonadota bacterium]
MRELLNRSLLLLFGCQVIFVAGTVVLVTIGGLVGHELAPSPGLATLPVALMVVGTAACTVPAALCMQALGRRRGFLVGIGLAACGAAVAMAAEPRESFWLFCAATALVGGSLAFSQQFRFAAAETVSASRVSHAVSFLLLGSIAGAMLSPEIIALSQAANPAEPFRRVFGVMLGLYALAGVLILGLGNAAAASRNDAAPARELRALSAQPAFLTAVLAGMIGQGVMTYIMTATPISMNVIDGFSVKETAEVIRAHVIAMYLPSLVTPFLIGRLGLSRVMAIGVVAMALTLVVGLAGHHLLHYWWSLVLLGVGWNFLFVSGTSMLTQSYAASERFRAQAVNDFSVFGASALASLLAGTMLSVLGWELVLLSAAPMLMLMLAALFWLARQPAAPQPVA